MTRTVSRAIAAVQAICALGLPAELLVPAVLDGLHGVVPSSRNLFDWTDAQGRLMYYYIEGPIDAAIARLYFDDFHNRREAEAMPAFEGLMRAPMGIRSAATLDTPAFHASALYREVWQPQGLKYRVEAVLRGRCGRLLGSLVLYRGPGDVCFTPTEERRLLHVLPAIAAALEHVGPLATESRYVPSPVPPESLVLDLSWGVQHATPGAHGLLLLATSGVNRASLSRTLGDLVRQVLSPLHRQVTEHARLHASGHAMANLLPPLPELRLGSAWGEFVLRTRLLKPPAAPGGDVRLLVDLLRHEPHSVGLARRFGQLPLTPGQAVVCTGLVQGQSHASLARQLGVATATVVDHVRKSYRALGVNSALELRTLVESQAA